MEDEKAVTSPEGEEITKTTGEIQPGEIELDEDADPAGEAEADGEKSPETDGEIVDVILPDDAGGTQPKKPEINKAWLGQRLGRAKRQVDAARVGATKAEEERDLLLLQNQQLKERIESKPVAPKRPNPDDFDDGVQDPKYFAALDEFADKRIAAQVSEQVAKLAPQAQPVVDNQLETRRLAHYQESQSLNADFEETEDAAISVLGQSNVDLIVTHFPNSPKIVYFLGKKANHARAREIAGLVDSNPVQALLALGRLDDRLTVKRSGSAKPAPNPDEELSGTSAPTSKKRGPKGATFT